MAFDPKDPADVALLEEKIAAAIEPLTAKRDELLNEVRKLKAKAKGADIDPEEHATLQTKVEELTEKLGKAEKTLKTETEKMQKQLGEKDGALRKLLVDEGLTAAAVKAGVAPHYLDAVKALHSGKTTIEAKDGAYVALLDGKPIAEALTTWAQSDQGKHFVAAPNNSGGGAQGGNGGKPAGKTIKQSELDAMRPAARATYMAENQGVQVVEG